MTVYADRQGTRGHKTYPASVKQRLFIGSLARNVDFGHRAVYGGYHTYGAFFASEWARDLYDGTLTSREASHLIDTLKSAPQKVTSGQHITTETGQFYGDVRVHEVREIKDTNGYITDSYWLVKATVDSGDYGDDAELVWYAKAADLFTAGSTYTIQARIKAHKVFRGQASTQLNYVKVKG